MKNKRFKKKKKNKSDKDENFDRTKKRMKRELSYILDRNVSSNYGNKLFKPPGGKISDGVIFTPKEELEKNENSS